MDKPRRIAWLMTGITLLLVSLAVLPTLLPGKLGPLAKITVDADPENMLSPDTPVRVFHAESKARFGLHDAVIVGIVNDKHPDGVFNPATLTKLHALTAYAKTLGGVVPNDVMSLATVDSIDNGGAGTVKFEWLMEKPPTTDAEAAEIKRRATRIPFMRDTLYSGDGKALSIFIALTDKSEAHDVSVALQKKIKELGRGDDAFHIGGLPVAEATFGVEMFVQMATSAPLAMLVIFLLMWLFFRRLIVIVSPMIVAMVAALTTMALLVITGNTIHIMSSMIPIFIMPIAVLDAVHIISDFFDRYEPGKDRRSIVMSVMRHLFKPMLFTSLTTTAGFASLALTPIPPVRVFGIFVALGVMLAWLWTILFIPAFLMMIPEKKLAGFGRIAHGLPDEPSRGMLARLNVATHRWSKLIIAGTVIGAVVSAYGISKININDNPTRWFESDHPIRIADREMNHHFAGTYEGYLSLDFDQPTYRADEFAAVVTGAAKRHRTAAAAAFAELETSIASAKAGDPLDVIDALDKAVRAKKNASADPAVRAGLEATRELLAEQYDAFEDGKTSPLVETLTSATKARAADVDAAFGQLTTTIATVATSAPPSAAAFRKTLAARTDETKDGAHKPIATFVADLEQMNDVFKRPDVLAYIARLQRHLESSAVVGKTNSIVDIVKTVHRDIVSGTEPDFRIPTTSRMVAQTLDQYLSSHRKDDLWHFVTPDYRHAVVWVHLNSGDNQDMEPLVAATAAWMKKNPGPVKLVAPRWFGLTYINVVWQDKMVTGMMSAFLGSFLIVLIMMIALFRSLLWGILSMIPLTVTVGFIYAMIGFVGKDYDMPVAVLSSLSLGLAVDYAIHFLVRARQLQELHGSWNLARPLVFGEPARAISRNIIVVGMGFLPLLLATLVPYQTVGILIAAILVTAGASTLIILPALLTVLEKYVFRNAGPARNAEPPVARLRKE